MYIRRIQLQIIASIIAAQNFMNKIKIINEQMLHLMQSTAKQFRVSQQTKTFNHGTMKRPKTPQQVFKTFIKESAQTEMHFKRKDKMKTTQSHFTRTDHLQHINRPESPAVIEKKFDGLEALKQRPNTAGDLRRGNKLKTQKIMPKQQMNTLKHDIDQVLADIKQQSELARQRMRVKYTSYEYKKFGKFWNKHNVSLVKRSTQETRNYIMHKNSIANPSDLKSVVKINRN